MTSISSDIEDRIEIYANLTNSKYVTKWLVYNSVQKIFPYNFSGGCNVCACSEVIELYLSDVVN